MRNAEYSIFIAYGVDIKGVTYPKLCFMPELQYLLNLCIVLGSWIWGVISSMVLFLRKQRGIPRFEFGIIPPCVCVWPYT